MSGGAERSGAELFDPHGGPDRYKLDKYNPLPNRAMGNPEFRASIDGDPSNTADHLIHIRFSDNGHTSK